MSTITILGDEPITVDPGGEPFERSDVEMHGPPLGVPSGEPSMESMMLPVPVAAFPATPSSNR